MKVVPISLKKANEFIEKLHRHNKPVQGHKFSIGVEKEGILVGVAIVGRPIARLNDNGKTLEVLRVCTDGTRNANSFLYGVCKRIVSIMGYERLITYTLQTESGGSLRAINAISTKIKGGSWSREKRQRENQLVSLQNKLKWEIPLNFP